jgi:hypothetical protein
MVRDREKLSSVLDSALQKSTNLAKMFKKVFNMSKHAGLCNQCLYGPHSSSGSNIKPREKMPLTEKILAMCEVQL